MEDKTFQLIEKLYNRMEDGFKSVRAEIQDVKTELKQDIVRIDQNLGRMEQNMVRMEQKYDNKIDILFDAVQGNTEAINSLSAEMKKLETKVDAHEIKLKIVK